VLRSLEKLRGYALRATDGDVGAVDEFYFDDQHWAVRYMVAETSSWLSRRVLIAPIAISRVDWTGRVVNVAISTDQVRNSPDVDLHRPVSRQYEADYFAYFGYAPYWGGPGMWAAASYPGAFADGTVAAERAVADVERAKAEDPVTSRASGDSHLHSSKDVKGHHIAATDGEIGHVDDFIIDDRSWAIRYIEIDTSNWIGGRSVLIPQSALRTISWADRTLNVALTRDQIERSPGPDESGLSIEYEGRLAAHYGVEHVRGESERL
jgi:PRC-barrel domain